MSRFDKVYRLLVGRPGQKGVEITQPIRIGFKIEKTSSEQPNTFTFTIYNLAPQTRLSVEEPDMRCVFYAGYAEEYGPILTAAGAITQVDTSYKEPDVVTQLTARDGFIEIRDTAVSLSYGQGVQASAVIREIAKQMGLIPVMADDIPDGKLTHGFSFYGPARTALHKITRRTGLEWSVQNQQLQVIPLLGTTKRKAVVLSADSGLIGYPERNRVASQEIAIDKDQPAGDKVKVTSTRPQRDGWTVTSLLLPQVNPGDLVKLESKLVTDFFRVKSVTHSAGEKNDDWQSELELIDPRPQP
jgi:hypothetical protein